jgi:hypothetical protein
MPDGIIARILLPWTTFSADFFRFLSLEVTFDILLEQQWLCEHKYNNEATFAYRINNFIFPVFAICNCGGVYLWDFKFSRR